MPSKLFRGAAGGSSYTVTSDTFTGTQSITATSYTDLPLTVTFNASAGEIVMVHLILSGRGNGSAAARTCVIGYKLDAGSDIDLTSKTFAASEQNADNFSLSFALTIPTAGSHEVQLRGYCTIADGFSLYGNDSTRGLGTLQVVQIV